MRIKSESIPAALRDRGFERYTKGVFKQAAADAELSAISGEDNNLEPVVSTTRSA